MHRHNAHSVTTRTRRSSQRRKPRDGGLLSGFGLLRRRQCYCVLIGLIGPCWLFNLWRFGGFFCSLPQPNVRLGRTSLREFVEAVVTPGRAPDGDGFHPCL